jgi:sterol desaturase/sphingolipid hydroxylase (fatty acid hydroxylase superfamily)
MPRFASNRDETVVLFRNSLLERLSHVHPATPVVLFLPVVAWMVWRCRQDCSWPLVGGLALGGLLAWTFTEYAIHRWVFHYHPTSALGKRISFLTHGVHHDYPRDSTRLVMPPAVSIPLAALFGLGFFWAFGERAAGVFAGFLLGYVTYDTIHFATHHWPMKGPVGRFLKEYHLKHHYLDDNRSFGVSSPLWDYVFGTVARRPAANR